jgi:rfaE bifunctional protein kinase chain/domain
VSASTSMTQTRKRLLDIVSRFRNRRILVAGDLIADEFLYGQIARVSREAPVLVLEYGETLRLPGGAANAVNNLLDLGCRVSFISAIGPDEAGRRLVAGLSAKGADVRRVIELRSFATPVKTRILAGAHHSSSPQQVVRIDRVPARCIESEKLWNSILIRSHHHDGIVLSDYGYGTVNPGLAASVAGAVRSRGTPVVVDSRFRMGEYSGVTSITPNITELEAATASSIGRNANLLRQAGRRVLSRQRLECLLVTQGRFGMSLFRQRGPVVHIPIYGTDEVADVTGAGDTVIAVFTLALACGADPEDAARLANYAGGVVVMKRGTATVGRTELEAAIEEDLSGAGDRADRNNR